MNIWIQNGFGPIMHLQSMIKIQVQLESVLTGSNFKYFDFWSVQKNFKECVENKCSKYFKVYVSSKYYLYIRQRVRKVFDLDVN